MREHSARGFTFCNMLAAIALTSIAMSLFIPDDVTNHLSSSSDDSMLTVRFFDAEYHCDDVPALRRDVARSLRDSPFDVCMLFEQQDDLYPLRIALWVPHDVPARYGLEALREALGTDRVVLDD